MYLRKLKIDTLDPDFVPIPKRENKLPSWIEPEEVTKLISYSNTRGKAIISLLYSSGIRVSELCQLNRDDLHDGRFTVVGKGNKPRICFYDARTSILLQRYLKKRTDNHPALFIQRVGGLRMNKSNIEDVFKSARSKAGFTKPITPHTMRHSFATQLMQSGMPIYSLSRLMGHSSIQTTGIYLHVSDPRLEEEYLKYHVI